MNDVQFKSPVLKMHNIDYTKPIDIIKNNYYYTNIEIKAYLKPNQFWCHACEFVQPYRE